jgi:hypothetical protein
MKHPAALPACQHALLARSPVGHVSVCPDCGVVHLSLDCLSVRLEKTAFMALTDMLLQAQKRLHSARPCKDLGSSGQEALVH